MPQESIREQHTAADETGEQETAAGTAAAGTRVHDQLDALDAVLDDIETTLETNAEDYVNSFVQKGGE